MKYLSRLIALLALWFVFSSALFAMPPAQMKQILNMTKNSWVSYRDFNGKQLIYFTHLESYRCGIKSVKYSINSEALDQEWVLQPCDPKNPMAVTTEKPYISLDLKTAHSIAIQLTFIDDTQSEVVHKKPS